MSTQITAWLEEQGVEVETVAHGLVPFVPRPFQERIFAAFEERENIIVVNGRCLGVSTALYLAAAWAAAVNREHVGVATSSEHLWDMQAGRIWHGWLTDTPMRSHFGKPIPFGDGSVERATKYEGLAISRLVIDDAGYCRGNLDIPCPASTHLVLASAPPVGSREVAAIRFRQCWLEPPSDMTPLRFTWREHPDRDEHWVARMLERMTYERFVQDHEARIPRPEEIDGAA